MSGYGKVEAVREPALVPRMRPFTSTIFAEMTALATRTGAVNLGQGFPDTDGPPGMLATARKAIAEGVNQYPPGPGTPELRAAVAEHRTSYGTVYDPDSEVLVTVGATEAITAALLALVGPGDEVIVIEPYYDSYAAAVALAGATRRVVGAAWRPRTAGSRLDVPALRAAVGPNTRAILVNSPHNPTGTVFTRDELAELAAALRRARPDRGHRRGLRAPGLRRPRPHPAGHLPRHGRADGDACPAPARRSTAPAGRSAGCAGRAELVAAVRATKQFLTFVGGAPFQPAVAHALRVELPWVDDLRDSLQAKRDRLSEGLAAAGFAVRPTAGTYFVCADVRPLGFADGAELCWALPAKIGVAAVPVQVFTDQPDRWKHLVRFAFCKRDEVLDEAVKRLSTLGDN